MSIAFFLPFVVGDRATFGDLSVQSTKVEHDARRLKVGIRQRLCLARE